MAEKLEWKEVWAFVTKIDDMEALELVSLKNVMKRPDWKL